MYEMFALLLMIWLSYLIIDGKVENRCFIFIEERPTLMKVKVGFYIKKLF